MHKPQELGTQTWPSLPNYCNLCNKTIGEIYKPHVSIVFQLVEKNPCKQIHAGLFHHRANVDELLKEDLVSSCVENLVMKRRSNEICHQDPRQSRRISTWTFSCVDIALHTNFRLVDVLVVTDLCDVEVVKLFVLQIEQN